MSDFRGCEAKNYSILRLNVGGKSYLISTTTALRRRHSLLAALASGNERNVPSRVRTSVYILKETGEYFVERSPLLFDLVLQYARTGHVQCPPYVCEHALREELAFWKLNDDDDEHQSRLLQSSLAAEASDEVDEDSRGRMAEVWHLFEYPRSSRLATLINGLCVFFILTSIVNFVASTEPSLRSSCIDEEGGSTANELEFAGDDRESDSSELSAKGTPCHRAINDWWFDVIEFVCTVWFTLEFALRFVSCPHKAAFVRSPLNIVDFLAAIPLFLEMMIYAAIGDHRYVNSRDSGAVSALLILMRVLRIVRVIRSFLLARYVNSVQLLCTLAWNSRGNFGLLFLFLSVGILIFSSLMYYAEKDEMDTAYTSITATFWWCVVTFSTVGYGDITPTSVIGRILAGVACISGILIITFPASIITDSFRCTYEAHKLKSRRRRASLGRRRSALAPAITVATVKEDYHVFETKL